MVKASKLVGVGASEGVVEGPVFAYDPDEVEPEHKTIPDKRVEEELGRFRQAIENVARSLTETAERLSASGRREDAAILEFHVGLVEDPELASEVEERVRNLESPEDAILAVGHKYATAFEAMDEESMNARADDVRDIALQMATELRVSSDAAVEEGLERFRQAV